MFTRYRKLPRKGYTLGLFLFVSGLILAFRLVPFIQSKQTDTPLDPEVLHIQHLSALAESEVASTTVELGGASVMAIPANRLIPLSASEQARLTHDEQPDELPLAAFWQHAQPAFYLIALTLILLFATWAYPRVVRRKPTR